jgi:hypothetical protein
MPDRPDGSDGSRWRTDGLMVRWRSDVRSDGARFTGWRPYGAVMVPDGAADGPSDGAQLDPGWDA